MFPVVRIQDTRPPCRPPLPGLPACCPAGHTCPLPRPPPAGRAAHPPTPCWPPLPPSLPSSLQAIDAFRPAHRLVERPLRLAVADVQRSGKGGVLVGGKLEGGGLVAGSRVLVMPSAQPATVK